MFSYKCYHCKKEWQQENYRTLMGPTDRGDHTRVCDECLPILENKREAKRREKLLEDIEIEIPSACGSKYAEATFDNFIPKTKSQQNALDVCRDYVKEYEGWLYLYGPPGTGKTHLAVAIYRAKLEAYGGKKIQYAGRFTTVTEMFVSIREEMIQEGGSEYEAISSFSGKRLLILDDLGVEKATDWAKQTLYTIISERERDDMPTVITSNLSLGEIEARIGDGRITSRIAGASRILRIEGEDHRIANRRRK